MTPGRPQTRHGLRLACLFLSAVLLLAAHAAAADWRDTEESLRQAFQEVRTVRAEFEQQKVMPLLGRPLVSTGRFAWQAPDRVRWEYLSPKRSVLLLDGEDLRQLTWRDGAFQRDSGAGESAVRPVLEDMRAWMSGRFGESETFQPSLEHPADAPPRMVLTPRDPRLAEFITRVDLVLADEPGTLSAIVIHEGADTRTEISFANVRTNETLAPALFTEAEVGEW